VTKIEKNMLRWFGHIERIDERRLTKEIYDTVMSCNAVRGRPRRTFLEQIGQFWRKARVPETGERV
jgi:hypothetical protein